MEVSRPFWGNISAAVKWRPWLDRQQSSPWGGCRSQEKRWDPRGREKRLADRMCRQGCGNIPAEVSSRDLWQRERQAGVGLRGLECLMVHLRPERSQGLWEEQIPLDESRKIWKPGAALPRKKTIADSVWEWKTRETFCRAVTDCLGTAWSVFQS